MVIGILGHVGNRNHGDEAIVEALTQNLRRLRPGVRLVAFTLRPDDTVRRHGIPAFPSRRAVGASGGDGAPRPTSGEVRPRPGVTRRLARTLRLGVQLPGAVLGEILFLAASFKRTRGLDLLVVAGSEQIMDGWGGPWAYPFTVMKWCLMARLSGTRVAFVSVGSTPLTSPLSRLFHSVALRTAAYRSYRDEGSKQLARRLVDTDRDPVLPDLVFSFDRTGPSRAQSGPRPRVLINPMAVNAGEPPLASQDTYDLYVRGLAGFIRWLQQRGCDVELFLTQERVDPPAVADLQAAIAAAGDDRDLVVHMPRSSREVLDLIARGDYVVATRFHGILFSLLSCKPVLAIAYRAKSHELMRSLGQEKFVVDVSSSTTNRLVELFLALEGDSGSHGARLGERAKALRAVLERQYETLVALAEAPAETPVDMAAREAAHVV